MPKKKNEEENVEATGAEAAEETPAAVEAAPVSEEKPKRTRKAAEPTLKGRLRARLVADGEQVAFEIEEIGRASCRERV